MVDDSQLIRMAMTFSIGPHQLSFETCYPQSTKIEDINSLADKLEVVATRQILKGKLGSLKQDLSVVTKQLELAQNDYEKFVDEQQQKVSLWEEDIDGKRHKPAMTSSEQSAEKNLKENVKSFIGRKEHIEEQIQALENYFACG